MPNLQQNISLLPYNSFGMDIKAKWFLSVESAEGLIELIVDNAFFKDQPLLILGGGSNILFTKDYEGLVLLNQIKGKEIIEEDEAHVYLKIGAGENWHELVLYCLANNWGGIENLSLIPGSVGAAPIQNIGAYGVELKDVFHSLEAVQLSTANIRAFSHEACQFGYRDSVFKRSAKGKYLITSVILKLNKKHNINSSYGAIQSQLALMQVNTPTIQDISKAVISIRQSKLPDPKKIGNGGSFFKNPVIDRSHFDRLHQRFPNIPHYPQPNDQEKLAAGWLIEQTGWKGKRLGQYGVHEKQALVMVNYGGAKGSDILSMAQEIQADVLSAFEVELEMEVNIV